MKNFQLFLFVAALWILSGCVAVPKPEARDGTTDIYALDFREYAKKDFLITPYPPTGLYESKGILEIQLQPQVISINKATYYGNNNQEYTNPSNGKSYKLKAFEALDGITYYYAVEVLEVNTAVQELYLKASEYEANAIVDFKVTTEIIENFGLTYKYINVSGLAIKTLN